MSPQFAKRSTQPLQAESYRAAARKLRRLADQLDARCEPDSPRAKGALTSTVYRLARFARALFERHSRRLHGGE